MDTITERGTAILTWRRGFEEDWDTYTVPSRVRFMDVPLTAMKGIVGMENDRDRNSPRVWFASHVQWLQYHYCH